MLEQCAAGMTVKCDGESEWVKKEVSLRDVRTAITFNLYILIFKERPANSLIYGHYFPSAKKKKHWSNYAAPEIKGRDGSWDFVPSVSAHSVATI